MDTYSDLLAIRISNSNNGSGVTVSLARYSVDLVFNDAVGSISHLLSLASNNKLNIVGVV